MKQKLSGIAIYSFIFGILSIAVGWIPYVGIAVVLTSITLGMVAMVDLQRSKEFKGNGLALAGLVLGVIFLFVHLLIHAVGPMLPVQGITGNAVIHTNDKTSQLEPMLPKEQTNLNVNVTINVTNPEKNVFDVHNPREQLSGSVIGEFYFPTTSTVHRDNGVSISIDELEIDNFGGWGVVTYIKTTILNEGDHAIMPSLAVRVYGEDDYAIEQTKNDRVVTFDERVIQVGEHISKEIPTSISFAGNDTKTVRLVLYDEWESSRQIATFKSNAAPKKRFVASVHVDFGE
jgi:hypothetical protein